MSLIPLCSVETNRATPVQNFWKLFDHLSKITCCLQLLLSSLAVYGWVSQTKMVYTAVQRRNSRISNENWANGMQYYEERILLDGCHLLFKVYSQEKKSICLCSDTVPRNKKCSRNVYEKTSLTKNSEISWRNSKIINWFGFRMMCKIMDRGV